MADAAHAAAAPSSPSSPSTAVADEPDPLARPDGLTDEQAFLRNVIRLVGILACWTGYSLAVAIMALDFEEHAGHGLLLGAAGTGGLLLWLRSAAIAKRLAPV
ncbi:MAG: hypothetical protein ACPGQL_02340 [Thermoplasmatota archaeon]